MPNLELPGSRISGSEQPHFHTPVSTGLSGGCIIMFYGWSDTCTDPKSSELRFRLSMSSSAMLGRTKASPRTWQNLSSRKVLTSALTDQSTLVPIGRSSSRALSLPLRSYWCFGRSAPLCEGGVLKEARIALAANRLVPVKIDDCQLPSSFESCQAAVMPGWDGTARHPELARLLAGLQPSLLRLLESTQCGLDLKPAFSA